MNVVSKLGHVLRRLCVCCGCWIKFKLIGVGVNHTNSLSWLNCVVCDVDSYIPIDLSTAEYWSHGMGSTCWRGTLCNLIILSFNGGIFKAWLNIYHCRRGRGCCWCIKPMSILCSVWKWNQWRSFAWGFGKNAADCEFLCIVYCAVIVQRLNVFVTRNIHL